MALKILYFHFCKFTKKNKKINLKVLQIIMKTNDNTWNLKHLVDKSFVPANQRTSVLYCRLSDFMSTLALQSWITIGLLWNDFGVGQLPFCGKNGWLSQQDASHKTDRHLKTVCHDLDRKSRQTALGQATFLELKSMSWVEADNGVQSFLK